MEWEAVGYGLLFALPMALGIAAATMRMSGQGLLAPIVFGPALFASLVVFGFVWAAARTAGADAAATGDPTDEHR